MKLVLWKLRVALLQIKTGMRFFGLPISIIGDTMAKKEICLSLNCNHNLKNIKLIILLFGKRKGVILNLSKKIITKLLMGLLMNSRFMT